MNTTSFHFSRKAPTSFSFPYKSFYPHALQSASARTSSPLLDNVKDSKSKNKFFDVELEVREYELDQYGVVHNSVYSCYCQQGWSDFMKSIGINHNEAIESGSAWAMSEISLKFIAPLRSRDKFIVRIRPLSVSAACFCFSCFIYKQPNQEPILEANVKGVYLNRYYRPIRILKDMKFKMVKFINENDI
ncbi:acyl-acyl carrier protein thioesterase ATL3, chloroplastic isoform X1 [Lathyrus oleraceus]|uniref:acyl-acyl carrier protein thioesterase ATL3, chloroplastic isoform X1 n=1 Tax=Pisum sativum TaxID=3888 RepID=UPI0021D049ED|nr:acyl-acyl carrier protein thioesterase ATL3, chloroplastic-like isoform X1 [Pisum sativum]